MLKNVIFESGMKITRTYFSGILLVVICALFNPVYGAVTASNLRFQYLTTAEGLAQNTVDCIFQDSKGFMWFGTWNGLSRYDGYTFKTYQKGSQPSGLPDNFIRSFTEDRSGNFWIGTAQGVIAFNPNKEEFFLPDNVKEVLQNSAVTSIICDQTGKIWIGAEKGQLFRIFPHESKNGILEWTVNQINTGVLSGRNVNVVYCRKNNDILVGTTAGIFKVESDRLQRFAFSTSNPLISENINVSCICETHNNDLYIGTDAGLYWMKKSQKETVYITNVVPASYTE